MDSGSSGAISRSTRTHSSSEASAWRPPQAFKSSATCGGGFADEGWRVFECSAASTLPAGRPSRQLKKKSRFDRTRAHVSARLAFAVDQRRVAGLADDSNPIAAAFQAHRVVRTRRRLLHPEQVFARVASMEIRRGQSDTARSIGPALRADGQSHKQAGGDLNKTHSAPDSRNPAPFDTCASSHWFVFGQSTTKLLLLLAQNTVRRRPGQKI